MGLPPPAPAGALFKTRSNRSRGTDYRSQRAGVACPGNQSPARLLPAVTGFQTRCPETDWSHQFLRIQGASSLSKRASGRHRARARRLDVSGTSTVILGNPGPCRGVRTSDGCLFCGRSTSKSSSRRFLWRLDNRGYCGPVQGATRDTGMVTDIFRIIAVINAAFRRMSRELNIRFDPITGQS